MCGGFVGETLASVDPGPSIGGALADIDPGPAIGSGLAEVDDFVNDEIPGGWALPAALAVAYATGYIDPSLFATEAAATAAAEAGAGAIATEAGQAAFFEALAAGATSAEAVSAGLGVEALAAGAGSAAAITEALPYTEAFDAANLAKNGLDAAAIQQNLTATGMNSFLAQDMASLAAQGLSEQQIMSTLAASYTPAELAGTGIESLNVGAASNLPSLKDAQAALAKANAAKNLVSSGYNLVTGQGVPRPTAGSVNLLNRPTSANISADLSGGPQNITADLTKGNTSFSLNDFGGALNNPQLFNTGTNPAAYTAAAPTKSFNEGGGVEGHNPTFFSPGGLASMENTYVKGEGDGTSDSVAAMLANGEFVIPADVVSKLGNGSNDAGAGVLDEFLSTIREHAQRHNPKELPPDSKGPLAYLAEANKKARA